MVKLIICDVDGTLMPAGQKSISDDILSLIKEATRKGITFAVASGRPYHDLKRLFDKVSDQVVFLPSDGAATVYKEKTYFSKPVQRFVAINMVKPLLQAEGLSVTFSGKYISYCMSKDPAFLNMQYKDSNNHIMEIKDFSEIEEDIYKISIYGSGRSVFSKKIMSGTYTDMTRLIYKDNGWTEFISKEAGKEAAVNCMTKHMNITPGEMVVIGDNINDTKMLKLTENSFAVAGGHKDAVEAAKKVTENVTETLRDIIRKGDI